jgi:hypothetical protein
MSSLDRLLSRASLCKCLLLLVCAAMAAASGGCDQGPETLGAPCTAGTYSRGECRDEGLGNQSCLGDAADVGACTRICGNSGPNPESDIPCPDGNLCLTTDTPHDWPMGGGQSHAIVRLCFNACDDDGGCAYGEPTIAADGSCACIPDPIKLHNGGF